MAAMKRVFRDRSFPWWFWRRMANRRDRRSVGSGVTAQGNFATGSSYNPADVSVSRASAASYFGADGLLKTAAANELRIDHDPVTKARKGLLVEAAATNLFLRSQELDDPGWSKTALTVTANAGAAPDGTMTADALIPNTSATDHFLFVNAAGTAPSAAHPLGGFFKAAGMRYIAVRTSFSGWLSASATYFDLQTGAVASLGSGHDAIISALPNGWYRCTVTSTTAASGTVQCRFSPSNSSSSTSLAGDGTSGVLAWGAQLETGAAPTSYILTTAAAATRSADSVTLAATGKNDWTLTLDNGLAVPFAGVTGPLAFTGADLSRPYVVSYRAVLAP